MNKRISSSSVSRLTYNSERHAVRKTLFKRWKLTDVLSLCFHTGHPHLNREVGGGIWDWDVGISAKQPVRQNSRQYFKLNFRFYFNLPFPLCTEDLAIAQIRAAQVHVFPEDSCDVARDLNNLVIPWMTHRTKQCHQMSIHASLKEISAHLIVFQTLMDEADWQGQWLWGCQWFYHD